MQSIYRFGIRTAVRNFLQDWKLPIPPELKNHWRMLKNHPEGQHVVGLLDVRELYNLVRTRKPKICYEFGTGIGASTVAIAMAMNDNGQGHLVTFEQREWIKELAKDLSPQNCQDRIEYVYAPPVLNEKHGYRWAQYDSDRVDEGIDLVIIDGPGRWEQDGVTVSGPNGDLLRLVPHLKPGALVWIDGRATTSDAIRSILGDEFEFNVSRHAGWLTSRGTTMLFRS